MVNDLPNAVMDELSIKASSGGLMAALIHAAQHGINLTDNFAAADAVIKALRKNRMNADAMRLAVELARHHPNDSATITYCFNLLHRCGGWTEALDLLTQAKLKKKIKYNSAAAITEAHCLLKLGRIREAHSVIAGIAKESLKGELRVLLDRVLGAPLPVVAPEISKIEADFKAGNFATAVADFSAIIHRCRQAAAETAPPSVRDVESAQYAKAFLSAKEHGRINETILLVADSISMARPAIGVNLQDTYPWLTQVALAREQDSVASIEPDCRRGRTIRDLREIILKAKPGLGLIVQVGIVDCAPRVFNERDVEGVAKVMGDNAAQALTLVARTYRGHLQGNRETSVYVPLEEFRNLLAECVAHATAKFAFVILINIVTPSRGGKKMRGTPLAENIAEYNAAISDIARQHRVDDVDLDSFIWSLPNASLAFTGDNYHFNRLGHQYCSQKLYDRISTNLTLSRSES